MELIKKEGGKVAELAESVDKEKVAKEIECLGQRWNALLKKAESRSVYTPAVLNNPLIGRLLYSSDKGCKFIFQDLKQCD